MTLMEVTFRYGVAPDEAQMRAVGGMSEVYGIRGISFNEKDRTLRIDYDGSRLSEVVVAGLLRRAGIDLKERLVLTGPPQNA